MAAAPSELNSSTIEVLRAEMDDMIAWSNKLRSELDLNYANCHDFRQLFSLSFFFLLSPKRPLIQLRSTMTCSHILYLILSHVPFLLSYLLSSFGHFG